MRYETTLSDFKRRIFRNFFYNEKKDSWRDKYVKWKPTFMADGMFKSFMNKDSEYMREKILSELDNIGVSSSSMLESGFNRNGCTVLEDLMDVTAYVAECNDPEVIGTETLKHCGYEMALFKDYTYGFTQTPLDKNYNIRFIIYINNESNLGFYWRDISGESSYEERCEKFRNCFEENKGKDKTWGDFNFNLKDENLIEYYIHYRDDINGEKIYENSDTLYRKNIEFSIDNKEDIDQFWNFIYTHLPTIPERRDRRLGELLD